MKGLAARVADLPAPGQDLMLAAALTALDIAVLLPYRGSLRPLPVAVTLVVAQNLPLALRRRWPVAVLSVIGAARVGYDLLGLGYAPLPLGPAIGYYTVMSQCSLRSRQVVTALVLSGIIASQAAAGHHEPYDFAVAAMVFLTAGTAGLLTRAYVREVRASQAAAEARRDLEIAAAAARERAAIARELHDVVAHHVSLIAVQAEATASLLPGRPADASRSADLIADTARQALSELRRLLGVLRGPGERPQTAPAPSLTDIESVIEQVRLAGLTVDLHVKGAPGPLAPGVDLAAYRIVQEALTNTIRHSAAARTEVTVCYEPGYVTISIDDSGSPPRTGGRATPAGGGRGMEGIRGNNGAAPVGHAGAGHAGAGGDQAEAPAGRLTGGFGLAGITERVASCGGSLSVGPTGSGGFGVTARLPAR